MLTGKTTDYILPIENGQIKVGHGMCAGAFHFDNGDKYEVIFSLLDQSGNRSELTKAMPLIAPSSINTR